MNDQQKKAKAVFDRALELESLGERDSFLSRECANDAELRAQVEGLLMAYEQAGSFLESPPAGVRATVDQPITEKPGTVIGPYKLLQQIGEGGMGVVYMAEQAEPVERRVALKIIKPGMDTRQVIARFEAEGQALAMMDHPNIAKVLDAGTTESGRPYFVMELVKGIPITEYCDRQHLTPKERLELFIPVCQAVQHAHQKGIIHRDIKPSNILVALYDGRAGSQGDRLRRGQGHQPEADREDDVHAVWSDCGDAGVHEPRTGQSEPVGHRHAQRHLFAGCAACTSCSPAPRRLIASGCAVAGFDEMLRIIREEEPPKPSTRLSTIDTLPSVAANRHIEPKKLSALVRGELDWIVMKALEKDRARRYETASGLGGGHPAVSER